jgi:methylamine dehydrogenase accessory protein MauD
MGTALLVARLLLAGIFLVAGVAKLADRTGSRQAAIDFGLPKSLAAPLGIVLPIAELTVAAALIPTTTAWWGALGALALLFLFIVGIGVNLARGHKPDCHCFGQLHSSPAGWSTLARNGILAAVAGFILWGGREGAGPSAVSWLGTLSTGQLLSLIGGLLVLGLLVVAGWFLIHLLRQNGRLLVRVEALEARLNTDGAPPEAEAPQTEPEAGLPVGAEAPAFRLQGFYGETLTLEALRAPGRPVLLIFTDPNCGPCTSLLPEIGRWQHEYAEKLTISLVSRGTPEENRTKSAEHGVISVLLQEDWEVSEAYQVPGTPSAVLVQPDGTIGSPVAAGPEAIQSLVTRTVGGPAQGEHAQLPVHPQQAQGEPCPNCGQVHADNGHVAAQEAAPTGLKIGEPALPLKLPNLKGKKVNLAAFRGNKTLVLFWNPGCGFCQQMVDDLKRWEADPPEGAPKLLLVSTGTVAENKAMGLRSTVVLDQNFSVGNAFGANGTPMAVLVDEEGNIASELVAGAPAVLALAGVAQDPSSNGSGGGQAAPVAASIGDPVPPIKLPDLDGSTVDLADLKDQETLMLFWNPGCGFCQRMLDDLKAVEADPPEGAPRILVVSAGTTEDNRAMGLRSTVVLDQGFSVGSAFGASGTPSAVLVDSEGKVASEVAVGAPAVLGLAGANQAEA